MPRLLDIDLEQVAQIVERRGGARRDGAAARPRPARYRPARRSDGAASRGIRPAPPARPARPYARRSRSCGPRPPAPAGCPSGIRACGHSRIWPSPRARRRPRCADRRGSTGTLGAALLPPVERARVPAFQRATQARVGVEPDIVRDQPVVIDIRRIRHWLRPPRCSARALYIVIPAKAGIQEHRLRPRSRRPVCLGSGFAGCAGAPE